MDDDLTGYAPLVQTSVTRFGTMVVIFFFISILDAPPETPTHHTAQFLERVAGAAAKRG